MRMFVTMLVFTVLTVPPMAVAQTAQDLDCAMHVKTAQGAIDKTTEDMKGMEKMPKDQIGHVNTLLHDAQRAFKAAQQACEKPKSDYDRAQAIAKAEAARGSAEAADILHWHYMKATPAGMAMPGMKK